jgi:serine/threonine-protein kinase
VAAAVDSQVPAPRLVGRYVLYGEIASGGMASVHFGRLVGPAGFARPVAIKRLHPQFAKDPDFVKMFFDEARLAARIAHPNVVPTLDVVNVDTEVFIVMEYVRGVTLAHLSRTLRERGEKIPTHIALGIVSGMLQGLHAAHEARDDLGERLDLVHRDVSPQNALVGTDGVTRLLDFGVAKAAGRMQTTRDGQLKGKLAYMAPEQVRGEALTRRTDIYAASVVLWEVLTAKRLFFANNEANVLANVLSAEVAAPSTLARDLPPSLDRVVLRGLERDPARRYSTAREMAADIDTTVGIASPTEIGDWVERIAGEELQGNARRIAAIERAAAVSPESVSGMAIPPEAEGPARAQSSSDRPTYAWGRKNATKARHSKWSLAVIGGGVVFALVASGLLLFHNPSKPGAGDPPVSANRVTHAPSAIGSTASPALEPASNVPALNVEDLAPSSSSSPSPSTPAKPAPAARAPGAATPRKAPPAGADCNPPYTVDEKGHSHFKPNCI